MGKAVDSTGHIHRTVASLLVVRLRSFLMLPRTEPLGWIALPKEWLHGVEVTRKISPYHGFPLLARWRRLDGSGELDWSSPCIQIFGVVKRQSSQKDCHRSSFASGIPAVLFHLCPWILAPTVSTHREGKVSRHKATSRRHEQMVEDFVEELIHGAEGRIGSALSPNSSMASWQGDRYGFGIMAASWRHDLSIVYNPSSFRTISEFVEPQI